MDVDAITVLNRIKRCVSTSKVRALNSYNHMVKQRMEEIEALIDILERKLEKVDENESET